MAADRVTLNTFRSKFVNAQLNINVITFNYTESFEKLLKYDGKHVNLGSYNNHPILLRRIEHIHGYINDRMVMGVNDISQILNKEFHENQNILEAFVKSKCNKVQKHTIDDWSKNAIVNSHVLCIFGSSIGDTDNTWWELIGEWLKQNVRLIIFEIGEKFPPRRAYKNVVLERKKKDYFLNKTKLNDSEKMEVNDKIIIGINTDMFNFK